MRPIAEVAAAMGLGWDRLEPYGRDKAKVPLDAFPEVAQPARVVVVTAITPTSAGEGKTTVALGLTDGLNQTGRRTVATIRQPSLGPLFGRKGGGTGGGRATAEPGAEINLHFTGDFHAIQSAHNFLAAMTDHAVRQGMVPEFTPSRMTWRRVTDAQDRALRHTVIGLGGSTNGPLRETGYDSSAASEIMAIIALAHDYDDLRARLASIVVGWNRAGRPVTAGDVRAVGSMMVLLKDALKPNVVQTQEGYPVVVHAGPFGNIAHGCSSIVADRLAQACADYVVTEAGFGVDLGFTKFMDIKVRQGGPEPDAAVVVATVRGLKWHGGTASAELGHADVAAVERGIANLRHAIEVVRRYGLPAVVAINRFPQDHPDEVAAVQRAAIEAGALAAVEAHGFADGGRGMRALADAVVQAVDTGDACVQLLYRDEDPLAAKVAATAERVFLAGEVQWTPQARATARRFEAQGWDFPVCIAKTHLSISADPRLRGAPAGHVFPVRELRVAAGARQVICLAGDIVTLPGLPPTPNAFGIDLAPDGTVVGLL